MATEQWRDIKNYEGFYQVSNRGNVRSLTRIVTNGLVTCEKGGRVLKPGKNGSGYLHITLSVNGSRKNATIHKLVAVTFLPNINQLPVINHIDGDKTNNDMSNLEWVTYSENELHAFDNNLVKGMRARRAINQYDLSGKLIATYKTCREAAKSVNGSNGRISEMANKKHKNNVYKNSFWRFA